MKIKKNDKYPFILFIIFICIWFLFAMNPTNRLNWVFYNLLILLFVSLLVFSYRKFRFSNLSYTLITSFLVLNSIGAHFTYSQVPYLDWIWTALDSNRNDFDRIVHFLFGFLMTIPIRELYIHIIKIKGFWNYFLPVNLVLSLSVLWEFLEWGAAYYVGGDATRIPGNQGDPWDSHKDTIMAFLGSLITTVVTYVFNPNSNGKILTKE